LPIAPGPTRHSPCSRRRGGTACRAFSTPKKHESANLLRLARAADLPIFSEGAARVLCGAAPTPATIGALAQAMLGDFGVTLGAQGSLWRIDGAIHEIPALHVVSVDTTGAGDVFHGAVAAGLAERMPLLEAARFATACAGLKCAHGNGWDGMPTRPQTEEALRRLGEGSVATFAFGESPT
jgi:sulfofructose kinase